jgi:pimeloyl-ACP methyl ester carboxylesterase
MRRHPKASIVVLARFVLPVALVALAGCSGATSSGSAPAGSVSSSAAASSGAASSAAASSGAASSGAASTGTDLVVDVDLGGRTVHLVCQGPIGGSAPTVIFESGLGAPFFAWGDVQRPLSLKQRACAYDRAGLGASPAAPEASRTTKDIVADLHAALSKAGVKGPYLMVGHSMGAWPVALYASLYPSDVAGAILIDPRGPNVSAEWRAALPPAAAGENAAVAANRDELGAFEHDPSMNPEHLDLTKSAAEANAVLDPAGPLFGDRPVMVLGAADTHTNWSDLPPKIAATFDKIWLAGQKALVAESTAGSFETVPQSNHEIQSDQPQAVLDAIEKVLAGLGG